jgi:hypothetical protein
MIGGRRCGLMLLLLALSGAASSGAPAGESRFREAVANFRLGFWNQAAQNFSEFVRRYPASPRVPEAILYQAELNCFPPINSGRAHGPTSINSGSARRISRTLTTPRRLTRSSGCWRIFPCPRTASIP